MVKPLAYGEHRWSIKAMEDHYAIMVDDAVIGIVCRYYTEGWQWMPLYDGGFGQDCIPLQNALIDAMRAVKDFKESSRRYFEKLDADS